MTLMRLIASLQRLALQRLALLLGALLLGAAACSGAPETSDLPPANRVVRSYDPSLQVDLSRMERRPGGLYVQDVQVGDGPRADSGDVVTVHYTGWLPQGRKFDSSRDRGRPFEVAIGYGRVIQGWDRGIVGMRVGGRRRLVIPPALAYGAERSGPIPPNSTLVFDVELLDVVNRTPEQPHDTAAESAGG